MKWFAGIPAIFLLVGLATGAQPAQSSGHSDQSTGPSQQTEHPTLGPRSGPALEAGPPPAASVTDVRRLLRIRTIYVESIDNSLSDKLVEALGKWGRFRLVTKAKDADATLRGTCLESRHLKHVHSEVYISDRSGKSVWQDTIYRPFSPPTLDQAVYDTVKVVMAHLEQTVAQAERQ